MSKQKKRYLRQVRADMARVDRLHVVQHPTRGRVGYRLWVDRDAATRKAFLDGLARAERKAGIPVYGLLGADDGQVPSDDTLFALWRVRDRSLVGNGPGSEITGLLVTELDLLPPV